MLQFFISAFHNKKAENNFTAIPRRKLKQPIKEIDCFFYYSLSDEE